MTDKQEILAKLHQAMDSGALTQDDIRSLIDQSPVAHEPVLSKTTSQHQSDKADRISTVDAMFYIAGIILFAAIISLIMQSWNDVSRFVHILISAGVGIGMWIVAYILKKSPSQNETRDGLINALLLTGSLSVMAGGFIIANEFSNNFEGISFIPIAIALAFLGATHIGFDRLIKRNLILLLGVILSVASLPIVLFSFLQDIDASLDAWCFVIAISAGILAISTRAVARMNLDRPKIRNALDSLAAFVALISIYIASYGDYDALWLIVLIAGIFGLFYISIASQSKQLLGSASFFLILTVVTIAFRYFSGYGITASLILAATGLLGSAAIAANINKTYFKN